MINNIAIKIHRDKPGMRVKNDNLGVELKVSLLALLPSPKIGAR